MACFFSSSVLTILMPITCHPLSQCLFHSFWYHIMVSFLSHCKLATSIFCCHHCDPLQPHTFGSARSPPLPWMPIGSNPGLNVTFFLEALEDCWCALAHLLFSRDCYSLSNRYYFFVICFIRPLIAAPLSPHHATTPLLSGYMTAFAFFYPSWPSTLLPSCQQLLSHASPSSWPHQHQSCKAL